MALALRSLSGLRLPRRSQQQMERAAMRPGRRQPSQRQNGPPRRLQVGAAAALSHSDTLSRPPMAHHNRTPFDFGSTLRHSGYDLRSMEWQRQHTVCPPVYAPSLPKQPRSRTGRRGKLRLRRPLRRNPRLSGQRRPTCPQVWVRPMCVGACTAVQAARCWCWNKGMPCVAASRGRRHVASPLVQDCHMTDYDECFRS